MLSLPFSSIYITKRLPVITSSSSFFVPSFAFYFSFRVFILVFICSSPFVLKPVNVVHSTSSTSQPVAYISRRGSNSSLWLCSMGLWVPLGFASTENFLELPPTPLRSYTNLLERWVNVNLHKCESKIPWTIFLFPRRQYSMNPFASLIGWSVIETLMLQIYRFSLSF
jgi:hypothetical protein